MGPKVLLKSKFKPAGDQPEAIRRLLQGIRENRKHQVLLGVTGSGKTFTMANVIEKLDRPARIVLTRPVVEAGEKLGFLPGDLYEKVQPYLTSNGSCDGPVHHAEDGASWRSCTPCYLRFADCLCI